MSTVDTTASDRMIALRHVQSLQDAGKYRYIDLPESSEPKPDIKPIKKINKQVISVLLDAYFD